MEILAFLRDLSGHPSWMGLIAVVISLVCFWSLAIILACRLHRHEGLSKEIKFRLWQMIGVHTLVPSAFIGAGVFVALWWLQLPTDKSLPLAPSESLKVVATIVAGGYFAYQVLAGAFFSTTSIAIQATRDPNDPSKVLVTATLTRGDNWLAVIVVNSHQLECDGQLTPWLDMRFPRRLGNRTLRLGPKEQTSTTFIIDKASKGEITITARIESYSIFWPVASESYARTSVLAAPLAPKAVPQSFAAVIDRLVKFFTGS
jgi:hypothetical protein